MHGRSLHPRCGNRKPSKMQVSSGKPTETKAGIQMFVKMQGHGRPGLSICANILLRQYSPIKMTMHIHASTFFMDRFFALIEDDRVQLRIQNNIVCTCIPHIKQQNVLVYFVDCIFRDSNI